MPEPKADDDDGPVSLNELLHFVCNQEGADIAILLTGKRDGEKKWTLQTHRVFRHLSASPADLHEVAIFALKESAVAFEIEGPPKPPGQRVSHA